MLIHNTLRFLGHNTQELQILMHPSGPVACTKDTAHKARMEELQMRCKQLQDAQHADEIAYALMPGQHQAPHQGRMGLQGERELQSERERERERAAAANTVTALREEVHAACACIVWCNGAATAL